MTPITLERQPLGAETLYAPAPIINRLEKPAGYIALSGALAEAEPQPHAATISPNVLSQRNPETETPKLDPLITLELLRSNGTTGLVHISTIGNHNIEPSDEVHVLPPEMQVYLDRVNRRSALSDGYRRTKDNDETLRQKGVDVDSELLHLVSGFLENDSRSAALRERLNLDSVTIYDLSPKDTIMLLGYLMHELTNYDTVAAEATATTGTDINADKMNSLDLVRNGLGYKEKSDIPPLGVCRNYADVTEALFNALKSRNGNLKNTYCCNVGGFTGASVGTMQIQGEAIKGHAWIDFVSVTQSGDMVITTVDPTWIRRGKTGLANFDQTRLRMGTHLRNIILAGDHNYTYAKEKNLASIQTYYIERIQTLLKPIRAAYGNEQGTFKPDTVAENSHRNALNKAAYNAIEYIYAAESYGGSTFYQDKNVPQVVKGLIKYAAKREDYILSPKEYNAIQFVFARFIPANDKNRKISEALSARYAYYSKKDWYKNAYRTNDENGGGIVRHEI